MGDDKDQPTSGIKTYSVGFGETPAQSRSTLPPPAYRVLIAGDLGTKETGLCEITGQDISELLKRFKPELTVEARNILGSMPAMLSETIALDHQRDLRPANLLKKMAFAADARAAAKSGTLQSDKRFDKIDASAPSSLAAAAQARTDQDPSQAAPPPPSASAGGNPASEDGDLDRLFSMVETPAKPDHKSGQDEQAKQLLNAYIAQSVSSSTPGADTSGKTDTTGLDAALASQAAVFLDHPRFSAIYDNWQGLKVLLANMPADAEIRLFFVQFAKDADPDEVDALLSGPDGPFSSAAFDVVLYANRCALSGPGVGVLKKIARSAEENAVCAITSLEPDFAGLPAEDLAWKDAPHQALESDAFSVYRGLRQSSAGGNLALFWNDACVRPLGDGFPALFVPAAWIAVLAVLVGEAEHQWPRLATGIRFSFDHLDLLEHGEKHHTVASVGRAHVAPQAAEGLASAGISCLEGQANRSNVFFRSVPVLREVAADEEEGRGSVNHALTVARLNTLLQLAFVAAPPDAENAEASAEAIGRYLSDLSDALQGSVTFSVEKEIGETGGAILNIDAHARLSGASTKEFGFAIEI